MKRSLAAGVFLAILASTSTSFAQQAKGFGDKGQLIIGADSLFPLFGYTQASTTTQQNGTTTKTSESGSSISLLAGLDPQFVGAGNVNVVDPFTLPRVSVDYVVVNHIAVGGS